MDELFSFIGKAIENSVDGCTTPTKFHFKGCTFTNTVEGKTMVISIGEITAETTFKKEGV